jgi:hypothetical protein
MKSYGIRNGVRPTITTAEEGTIALVAGDKGAIFYNTDTDSLRTWDGSAFQNVGGGVGPDTVGVTELKPELKAVDIPMVSAAGVYGDASFTTSGATTWTAPTGVTSVSVVCVGGGGGGTGGSSSTSGGGGGALGWKNSITVVPGTTYNVQVGSGGAIGSYSYNGTAGGESYFQLSTGPVQADGGSGGQQTYTNRVPAVYIGDGGGDGGLTGSGGSYASGGGGAGGYSGAGGSSTNSSYAAGGAGLGGGGGAGGNGGNSDSAGSGGGVGLLGEGTSGAGGNASSGNGYRGAGGSGGADGTNGDAAGGCFGGDYGGGGGSADNSISSEFGVGGDGAVRILWGSGRSFPSTDTGTGGTANPVVDIDWSLGIQTDVYTMTADTDFTFSNLQAGKTITIRITGAFTPTLPSGLNTDWYDGSEINHIQVYCADSSTPTFVKLFPEASPFPVPPIPSLRGTPSTASGAGASLTLSPPTLCPAGDFMIIVARTGYGSATYTSTTLTGWTKLVTGGPNYACSVIFYKISTGTETAVTITSTGQSNSVYQHPSGIWASFKDCVGIGASTNYFSDTAAYTTKTIAGVTGSADSLEVCVMAAGQSGSGSPTAWGVSGGSWSLESSVVNTARFYFGGCAIAIVPGGSPATSPSAITINTGGAFIRQQAMLRLVST